jgi:hypothetical protein
MEETWEDNTMKLWDIWCEWEVYETSPVACSMVGFHIDSIPHSVPIITNVFTL